MVRYSVALILLAAVTIFAGQTADNRQAVDNRPYKLTVDVDLVELPVSVLDKHGFPLRGLQRHYFTVYEDKVQQDISLFKEEDIPLSITLLIDASGSMASKLVKLRAAALTFIRESNPQDETSIVSFANDVVVEQDLTHDTRVLNQALNGIRPNGDTALYDGVYLASKYLDSNANNDKKVVLLISDGEDNKSEYTMQRVLEAVGESKVMVYTIGILRSNMSDYVLYGDKGKSSLKKLAEVSGGASYFPNDIDQIEDICTRIARDLRNQYTIGYRPSNQNLDGTWRKVQVRLDLPKNLPKGKVRTKQGYYAPGGSRQANQNSMK